jgi:hypothetical protein
VSKDGFDASIGLAFSLELFKRYRRNGVVQAELPRAPGIRGHCKAFLHLVNGEIVSVYLEDKQGQRLSSDKAALCRLDAEKGPFEWRLLLQPDPPEQALPGGPLSDQSPGPDALTSPLEHSAVPRIISTLPQDQLSTWTSQRRDALYITLANIDGENTIEDIRGLVPLSSDLVDEALRLLLGMKVIVVSA